MDEGGEKKRERKREIEKERKREKEWNGSGSRDAEPNTRRVGNAISLMPASPRSRMLLCAVKTL